MRNLEDESIIENNERFWLQMTKKGTLQYCHEMLKLSVDFQLKKKPDTPYEEHLCSIDNQILEYMDYVVKCTHEKTWSSICAEASPFPYDLHAYIHGKTPEGKFQPNHLMCKLAALRDEDNKLVYEFLIEYDIFETDVEIYFGVKAVSDSWVTTPTFQEHVLQQWEIVKEAGSYKRNLHRFKMTNNGNNGTFWPFWWRLGMDCKEELSDAIEIIRKFYNDYKKALLLDDIVSPRFDIIKDEVENSLRASKDYEDLLKCIKEDFNQKAMDYFETLIDCCIDAGFIRRNESVEKMFICMKSSAKIVCILKVFFYTMTWIQDDRKPCGYTPTSFLSKVFLDKKGRTIKKKTWQITENSALTSWDEAKKTLKAWFPNIEVKGERRTEK